MALGVYLSFRVLDFPDLTVDGALLQEVSVAATMIVLGYNPFSQLSLPLGQGLFLQDASQEFYIQRVKLIHYCLES